jgi:hypothetical protein
MKCGSTSLIDGLNTHDEIYALPEEPRYSHSSRYEDASIEEYFALFGGHEEAVVGEGSGFYS